MGRNDDSSSSSEAGRTFARPARASRVLRGGRIVAEACEPLHQAPMASGDSSSSYPFNRCKDTNNQDQGTVAQRHGGPDVLSGPAAGAPSSSWMSWGVPRDLRDEGGRHQVAASSPSSQSLQRSPGALDVTMGAGTSEQAVKNPPKRKLSKSFPKDWAEPEVDDALPMKVGNRRVVVGAAPTKKTVLKRAKQLERLVRALQGLHITDAAEEPGRARTKKGVLKMDLDCAEGPSGQGRGRQTASEHGKESKKRSKGQKKKAKRASSADAVMARLLKEKEAKKKPRGAGGKQRQSDGQQKPKTDPPKAGKKSGPSTCSGGGKSKRPRRTSSDPGSPSFVKLKSYVHLR